jgi:hypothetical protein
MSIDTFDKNSLGWQLAQWQQQLQEWWEGQTLSFLPQIYLPDSNILYLWELTKFVFLLFLIALIVWGSWQFWQRFSPLFYRLTQKRRIFPLKSDFSLRKTSVKMDWLTRSRQFQSKGNYKEACLCCYFAVLQALDEKDIILEDPSRTDGEYLILLEKSTPSRPYQFLLKVHEELSFGNREASASLVTECQKAYQEITQIL